MAAGGWGKSCLVEPQKEVRVNGGSTKVECLSPATCHYRQTKIICPEFFLLQNFQIVFQTDFWTNFQTDVLTDILADFQMDYRKYFPKNWHKRFLWTFSRKKLEDKKFSKTKNTKFEDQNNKSLSKILPESKGPYRMTRRASPFHRKAAGLRRR